MGWERADGHIALFLCGIHADIAGYKGKQRLVQQQTAVTVAEDDDDDDNEDMDNSYEASFAPGNDSDYFVEEDADGRFFGGGLSSTQKQVRRVSYVLFARILTTLRSDSGDTRRGRRRTRHPE